MELEKLERELFDEVENYFEIKNEIFYYLDSIEEQKVTDIEYNENGYSSSTNIFKNEKHKIEILNAISSNIKSMFLELYDKSKIENYYWSYCSFRVYENSFERRKNIFLDKYDDLSLNENDFIKSEIYQMTFYKENPILDLIDTQIFLKIEKEFEKKISFIDSKNKGISKVEEDISYFIFTSKLAKELFDRYFESYIKDNKNKLADVSFVYRKMYSKQLISNFIRPEMFKNFINKPPYSTEINSSLKVYDNCKTKEKETNFSIIYQLVFKE